MMSRRTSSTRLSGTGPERRIIASNACAWRRGMVWVMAWLTAGSAPFSAIAHISSGTSSVRRSSTASVCRDRMKKSYMRASISLTISGSWPRSSSIMRARSPGRRLMMSAVCCMPSTSVLCVCRLSRQLLTSSSSSCSSSRSMSFSRAMLTSTRSRLSCGSASTTCPASAGGRKARNTACMRTCSPAMRSASHFGDTHCRRAIFGRMASP
ncbi:hypothetical protein D3C85_1229760 [compost metagenome]